MTDYEKLESLCRDGMERNGFVGNSIYELRLIEELAEIKKLDDAVYFIRLFDRGIKSSINEHNSLIPFLLGICDHVDIKKGVKYTDAEFPDIDVDFLPDVRSYLKDDWVPKKYGEQYVCNISNYNTFGLKSSLIDIARTLGEDRNEILNITTKLGMKDDEGDPLTWETAQELYHELAEYLKAHPRVAEITKGLVHADIDWEKFGYKNPPHRKRGMGMHASGLVISSVKVSDFVPMVVSSGNREKGLQASAWVEGLADTDLSSVGFIKFDFLSLEANAKIAECNKIIRSRHGLDSICAFAGMSTWSDTSYLNDAKALEMANKGDLKGIFQFDSDGIRKLVRTGGVSSFDDLAAYTALYRPGPMDVGMHDEFINRKHGKKTWELPPVGDADFLESMKSTYGVLCYQEQVMRYLSNVGKIPIAQCQGVIKAISKKKVEKFKKYRDEFIKNCQITLNITEEKAIDKWAEVESFAGYGFNLSMTIGTLIPSRCVDGIYLNKQIQDFIPGDVVLCVDETGNTVETEVLALHDHGILEGYKVTFDDGYEVICTLDHKFLTQKGQKSLREIIGTNSFVLCDPQWERNARKKEERMDFAVRNEVCKSQGFAFSFQEMHDLSEEEVCNRGMGGKMWSEVQNQNTCQRSPARVCGMQEIGVEDNRDRWSICDRKKCCKMRCCVGNMAEERGSPKDLSRVCDNQACQHQSEKFENKSIRRTSVNFIQDCKINICSTRDSESKIRKSKIMEGSQSGETCAFNRSGMEKSEGFKGGKMASATVGVGNVQNQMWRGSKASRFSKRKYLDRSGWILPFQRISASWWKPTTFSCCSTAGRDVEQRGDETKKCNVVTDWRRLFRQFNGGDESGMVGVCKEHAPITNIGRLVSRKIIRVTPVGVRQMYDLEVSCSTHNFILPNGVVTSNSHSVAYTYISSRQLWQKAHYPIEFYCEDLAHLKTADERIRFYIDDARVHGIKVNRLDLNKSGENFSIVDKNGERNMPASDGDEIYYGFSKIKGIGDDPAQRIVKLQPYSGFIDFLERFGTDAKVVQALIALRVFKEADPIILYKFYETYKKKKKKEEDRGRRNVKSVIKYKEQLKELCPNLEWLTFDEVDFSKARPYVDVAKWKEMTTLKKKYDRCVETFAIKTQEAEESNEILTLENFNAAEAEIDPETEMMLKDQAECEIAYYGFEWEHPLTKCEDYRGFTWEQLHMDLVQSPQVLPVEVLLKSVETGSTKSGKPMLKMRCEDAFRQTMMVTAWKEEIDRFGEDLKPGACVRIRVKCEKAKDRDSYWYNLESFGFGANWQNRSKMPKDKVNDTRVYVMKEAKS